ncbi:MAG: PqqD family protein [Lentisphaerae bacterium]|nr:PqqD family protein [Lentisphaerota bacterium]
MDRTYQRRKDITEQQAGKELMLFDDAEDKVHVLNHSAAFIWRSLEKPVTSSDIEDALRQQYDVSGMHDLAAMVTRTLADFEEKRVLRG